MIKFFCRVQRAANQFGMFDFAFFKIYLFSVGILAGAYFATFWFEWITIVWSVAIISCCVTLIRLVQLYLRDKR